MLTVPDPNVSYIQVEDATEADDSEYEDPVTVYETVDFGRTVETEVIPGHEVEFLGHDRKNPLVRLGAQVFEGTHYPVIGMQIIIDTSSAIPPPARSETDPCELSLLTTTPHLLRCERVHLEQKRDTQPSGSAPRSQKANDLSQKTMLISGPPVILPSSFERPIPPSQRPS